MKLNRVWHALTVKRVWRLPNVHTCIHQGESWGHRVYLALVSVESHYWYGKVALVILVCDVIAIFLHEQEVLE